MVVKTLVSAAVTGLLLTAIGTAPAAAQQTVALASDSSFIANAGSVGLLQVKLGKLAEKNASSAAVKAFGKRMVTDYTATNDQLKEAAKQAAYPKPVILRDHQRLVNKFIRLGGSEFDRAYMDEMVKQHDDEVKLYQQESEAGRVESLKHLATKLLPELQQRQALATETAKVVGVQATASNDKPTRTTGGK